jgi:hypothetical protein
MGNEEAAPKTKGVTTELLASVDLGPEIEGKERSPTIEMESLRGIGLEWAGPRIGTHWLENRGTFRRWRSRSTLSGKNKPDIYL